uniref:Proline and serine rich 1 n=1 Tax=Cyprinus carpio TaxID=7962 RepID=A0A8C1KN60_CYPCA
MTSFNCITCFFLQKMVAIPTTKVANILNCFTFSKDRIIVLELIALNISDAQNFRPVDDAFRTHLAEKRCARRILEQVCKVGCKAPVAMISSCGMIPGNPYPKGKPSQVTGTFPRIPAKKDGDDATLDGKGIAARILGPSKPSPSTYNPHRPVPYPIPPCRPHATVSPSYSRPAGQQNPTSNISGTPAISPHNSTASTPATSQPQPTTPITPVFPGMVPSQNPVTPSPTPAPSPSVIKGPPVPAGSPQIASNSSGHTTPVPSPFAGMPPSGRNTPSVIKSHTPSGTPCGTPGPSTSIPPSPFHSAPRSETPTGGLASTPRATDDPLTKKGYPPSSDSQSALLLPGTPSTQSHSVIRSYTPSGMSSLNPGCSTPSMQGVGGLPVASSPSPKPSPGLTSQTAMSSPAGALFIDQHASSMARQGGGSGSNSPVPSAFRGPSRSSTPSLSSLVMPNSAVLSRPLGMAHGAASPQSSLPSTAGVSALHSLSSALGSQSGSSPAPHFPAMSPFPGAQSSISTPSTPTPPVSSVYSGLAHSSAPSPSPFGLGLTTAPSVFPGLPSGPNPAFPGFGGSGHTAAGSPVLSSLMGLPGASSSVATVAPLQAAAGIPSSSPVLPGFASAFSSNFNPTLVGQAGLTGSLQAPGGAAFPGLLSFPPGMPSFSTTASPAALSGLHNSAMQSALLQAHSASALDSYPPQPNGFTNYPAATGSSFPLQPGLHPQLGWQ